MPKGKPEAVPKEHWTKKYSAEELHRKLSLAHKRAAKRRAKKTGRPRKIANRRKITRKQRGKINGLETITAYTLGRVESLIDGLAIGAGVSTPILTRRVADILVAKTNGQVLGG